MDGISKLPVGLIETILCLLPIQEAGRTSILSREWRYHWTKIPKLVFVEDTFRVSNPDSDELSVYNTPSKKKSKFIDAIYQVLLIQKGPIHEFTLDMQVDDSGVEIDHILLHLSKKNTLKILKLDITSDGFEGYVLPISLFSLHQLTDLYLNDCGLFHEPPFAEFSCLTTLYLNRLRTYDTTLLGLLSSCPLLKRLRLEDCKLLQCYDGGTISDTRRTPIVDLFKCVPMIEYLSVSLFIVMCFVPERLPKALPTALVHLKYLCMEQFCFSDKYGLPFLALLIRSSPNLEKLKLVMDEDNWLDEAEMGSYTLEDYSDIMMEHLNEFQIWNYRDAKGELDFVKFILAKSPVLKKVSIFPYYKFDEDEESKILKSLSLFSMRSTVGEVVIYLKSN